MRRSNFIAWGGSREYGAWWFRIFGSGLQLKAPWSVVLFSERHGFRRFWPHNPNNVARRRAS